jgi:hypothetical protein
MICLNCHDMEILRWHMFVECSKIIVCLENGKAVKYKFASQHFVGPNIAYLKFKIKYLAVHIITHINWKKPQNQ